VAHKKKFEKHMNDEWGIVEAIKDKLSPCCQQTQGNENSQGYFIVGTIGLQCSDVITNLLKLLS
jgi:hypothetical protein